MKPTALPETHRGPEGEGCRGGYGSGLQGLLCQSLLEPLFLPRTKTFAFEVWNSSTGDFPMPWCCRLGTGPFFWGPIWVSANSGKRGSSGAFPGSWAFSQNPVPSL